MESIERKRVWFAVNCSLSCFVHCPTTVRLSMGNDVIKHRKQSIVESYPDEFIYDCTAALKASVRGALQNAWPFRERLEFVVPELG